METHEKYLGEAAKLWPQNAIQEMEKTINQLFDMDRTFQAVDKTFFDKWSKETTQMMKTVMKWKSIYNRYLK